MADVSIYNTIRSSKVNTGLAPSYFSTRIFDEDGQVCPIRSNVSDYGVTGVARDSINTYTSGCFSPLSRIVVENVQRPQYSTYLNADAINSPGIGDEDNQSDYAYQTKTSYDTQLGYNYTRPVAPNMRPSYKFSQARPVNQEFNNKQLRESEKVNCFMNRVYSDRNCDANS